MWWLAYALLAHVMNAGVFVVDKSLLASDSKISQPARYAALSGLVAAGAAVLLLISYASPTTAVVGWSLLAGMFWVAALWFFFVALSAGDPSVVVPLSGSAVPVFTWVAASLFLGERLGGTILMAIALLIVGGLVLSMRLSSTVKVPAAVITAAVVSGLFFALYFATVKYIYDFFTPFLAAFAYNRMGVGVVALLLLAVIWARQPKKNKGKKAGWARRSTGLVLVIFLFSKVIATGALLLQNYAISLGSVTIVNALQGTQYLFLLLLALVISRWSPQLFKEEISRVTVAQKLTGIVLIGGGLVMLVW